MPGEVEAIYIQSAVTLLVGTVAFVVYQTQKSDHKKDAANSILLEIQAGESAISKVRDAINNDSLDIDQLVLPSESWSAHKHLFVRDFDQDEWNQISEFYNKAALIDDALRYNKTAFASDVEQIRTNKQRILATYAEEAVVKALYPISDVADGQNQITGVNVQAIKDEYDTKARIFDQLYMDKQADYLYKPAKPLNDVRQYLSGLPNLTTSSAGTKLKKLAGV